MKDVTAWFQSWPSPPLSLASEKPVTVGQWFDSWPGFRSFLHRLVAAGIAEHDPDVQLWWAVVTNDIDLLRVALDRGADVDIRDSQIMARYRDFP
jgi:hypothetical protein